MSGLVAERRAVDIVYFNKLLKYGLDEQTTRWTEAGPPGWLISGTKSSWRAVTSGVPQGSLLGPVPVVFITDLDDGTGSTLSKFADDSDQGGVAETPEGRAAIQGDLARLEKWADGNLMKFNKKGKVLHLGKVSLIHQYVLGMHLECCFHLGSSLAKKDLGVLVDTRVDHEPTLCSCSKVCQWWPGLH
ncbi:hypothetical protein QYF61_015026 [Mycteria americana]|uniref:Rna-directed dna polymerase from mobile element jockey-like n=1 Tax=Mycteria americana TaxID=33587 RepID=A0AAN7NC67_MYCAM|nr:hypothetical protein QYF61_015026 [Mycteria americana]